MNLVNLNAADLVGTTYVNFADSWITEAKANEIPVALRAKLKPEEGRWRNVERPGYFGRTRDMKVASYDAGYGPGNWRLAWVFAHGAMTYEQACRHAYEVSYIEWFGQHLDDLNFVCSFGECIDNAMTNVKSGTDYTKQEAYSTHIQDIAVRNVLKVFGRQFEGPKDKILVIRSKDSEGFKYGPGNIPFFAKDRVLTPSLCPKWAQPGSVEDFWQSNKWLQVKAA